MMPKETISDAELRQLERRYRALQRALADLPWILQGSVVERPPPPDSSKAKTTFIWTRKVRNKTVTVSLSRQQAIAFRRAIKANREIEKTLKSMRDMSQSALLSSLPGPRRNTTTNRPRNTRKKPS
jgi:hypothetical protein